MKPTYKSLSELSSWVASASSNGYSFVHHQVSEASTSAVNAGRSVRYTVSVAIDQIMTEKATALAKELAQTAAAETHKVTGRLVDITRKVDANHKEIANGVETLSMGLGIATGFTAAGAAIAAPTGLGAVGVALGLTSAPLIVVAAPVIAAAATTVGVVSGGAYFYSRWRSKQVDDADGKRTTAQPGGA